MIKYKVLCSPKSIAYVFNKIRIKQLYEYNGAFKYWIKENPSEFAFLVTAFHNGELVGYSIVRPFDDEYSYNVGVWVVPEYRRQGIGLSIMKLVQLKRKDKLVADVKSIGRNYFYNKVQSVTGFSFNERRI